MGNISSQKPKLSTQTVLMTYTPYPGDDDIDLKPRRFRIIRPGQMPGGTT